MPKSPPWRVLGPLQAGSSPTPHHQRLHMLFTPSTTGLAGSGYAGSDFHRASPTCPQIKHRMIIMRDSAPAQAVEASRLKYAANRSAALQNGTSGPQMIARTRPHKQGAIRNTIGSLLFSPQTTAGVLRSSGAELPLMLSDHPACARRTSYRAPADSAH